MSNEYLNLDSHTCKNLLGEDSVRRIKRLITRINVKSYIICLNNSSPDHTNINEGLNSNLVGLKSPTIVHNTPSSAASSKKPDLITSCYYFCDDLNSSASNSTTATTTTASLTTATTSTPSTAFDKLKKQQQKKSINNTTVPNNNTSNGSLLKETKSYILEHVIEPTTPFRKLSILEAKKKGILNVEKGLYTNTVNNAVITIEEAIGLGLIGARVAANEKRFVAAADNSSSESQQQRWTSNQTVPKSIRNHESTTLTIESVLDPKTNLFHSVSDAIKLGILDQASLCYKNTLTGAQLSLNEAFVSGFVKGQLFQNQNRGVESSKILNEIILGNNVSPMIRFIICIFRGY